MERPVPDGHLEVFLLRHGLDAPEPLRFEFKDIKHFHESLHKLTVVHMENGRRVMYWWPWTAIDEVRNVTNSDEYIKQLDKWLELERTKAAIEGVTPPDLEEHVTCASCGTPAQYYIHEGLMG